MANKKYNRKTKKYDDGGGLTDKTTFQQMSPYTQGASMVNSAIPNTSPQKDTQGSEAVYGAMSKSGNPIVSGIGTLASFGHKIGDPIYNKGHQIDDATGGYVDPNKAYKTDLAQAFLDPLANAESVFKDKNATGKEKLIAGLNVALPGMDYITGSSKERVNRENKIMKEQFTQNKINTNNAQYTNLNIPTFQTMENGGYLNIYDLGGDMNQNGQLTQMSGPTHEQGGIYVGNGNEIEGGESINKNYVFSDTLEVPGTKRTYASQSKSIENKYKLRPYDALSLKTKQDELDKLKASQESLKAEKEAKALEKFNKQNPGLLDKVVGASQQQPQQPQGEQQMKNGGKLRYSVKTSVHQQPFHSDNTVHNYMKLLTDTVHRRYDDGGGLKDPDYTDMDYATNRQNTTAPLNIEDTNPYVRSPYGMQIGYTNTTSHDQDEIDDLYNHEYDIKKTYVDPDQKAPFNTHMFNYLSNEDKLKKREEDVNNQPDYSPIQKMTSRQAQPITGQDFQTNLNTSTPPIGDFTYDGYKTKKSYQDINTMSTASQLGMGVQGAGLVAEGALLAARNKYMPAKYEAQDKVALDRVSANEPLRQAELASAGYKDAISKGAQSQGQLLTNLGQYQMKDAMTKAGIVENVQNENAKIQAQEALTNAQIQRANIEQKFKVGEINQHEYDQQTKNWDDYIHHIETVGSGLTKDAAGYKTQSDIIEHGLLNGHIVGMNNQGQMIYVSTGKLVNDSDANNVKWETKTTKRDGGYLKNKKFTMNPIDDDNLM